MDPAEQTSQHSLQGSSSSGDRCGSCHGPSSCVHVLRQASSVAPGPPPPPPPPSFREAGRCHFTAGQGRAGQLLLRQGRPRGPRHFAPACLWLSFPGDSCGAGAAVPAVSRGSCRRPGPASRCLSPFVMLGCSAPFPFCSAEMPPALSLLPVSWGLIPPSCRWL